MPLRKTVKASFFEVSAIADILIELTVITERLIISLQEQQSQQLRL